MPESILDWIKKQGADFASRLVIPMFAVDDSPPTLADGDARPARLDKNDGGVVVHVANATGSASNAPSIVQGTDGVSPERLATEATLQFLAAPSTTAGVPKTPKDVPTGTAESIVSVSTPTLKLVRVQVEWNETLKSESVCVGDSTVTLANGIQLFPGDSYTEEVDDAQKLFCIGSVSGLKLRVQVL